MMRRRDFLTAAALAPLAGHLPAAHGAAAPDETTVWLTGDAAPPDPARMAARLARLAQSAAAAGSSAPGDGALDSYGRGGAVASLEAAFATLLGKEDCAFFPTGTLANQVAARVLAGENHRVLVQHESHFYRDESDAAARLSALNLVPLSPGQAVPAMAELTTALEEAEHGPYPLQIGAMAIESPVRRRFGEMVPLADLHAITSVARAHGARLHLDGARLLLAPPELDIPAYTAAFDTVYVSLYKYLGAPFGAVLAGDKASIAKARDWRHVQGGLLYQAWMPALLALDALGDFSARMAAAHAAGRALVAALESSGKIRRRPQGLASNIHVLEMPQSLADAASARGQAQGVHLAGWQDGYMRLSVNTTILRRPVQDYAALFRT